MEIQVVIGLLDLFKGFLGGIGDGRNLERLRSHQWRLPLWLSSMTVLLFSLIFTILFLCFLSINISS